MTKIVLEILIILSSVVLSTGISLAQMTEDQRNYDDGNTALWFGDYQKARQLLMPLAIKGHPQAQNEVGAMYQKGWGVPQSNEEAVKWYMLSAKNGQYNGQSNLAYMYENGLGVQVDLKLAYMWLNLAIAQNKYISDRRDRLSSKMRSDEIEAAQRLSINCVNSNYQRCGK